MKVNGLYLLEKPRNFGEINLVDHRGDPFHPSPFRGPVVPGLFRLHLLPGHLPHDHGFPERIRRRAGGDRGGGHPGRTGDGGPGPGPWSSWPPTCPISTPTSSALTGEFLDIHRFRHRAEHPVSQGARAGRELRGRPQCQCGTDKPRGDYHGFFKAPLDLAKMKVTYRSARVSCGTASDGDSFRSRSKRPMARVRRGPR